MTNPDPPEKLKNLKKKHNLNVNYDMSYQLQDEESMKIYLKSNENKLGEIYVAALKSC